MEKIDLKKRHKALYGTTERQGFVIVDVPELTFLTLDGEGDPNTAKAFSDAVQALFTLSYTLKFTIKKGPLGIDYGVMPLEALWWADDMSAFTPEDKSDWKWTAMILQPEWVTAELVDECRAAAARKKDLPALASVRLETFTEGTSVQCFYRGPYAEEGPTIAALHLFIEDNGYVRRGKHHEIYLSDANRTDPAKLKTLIRQPMKPA